MAQTISEILKAKNLNKSVKIYADRSNDLIRLTLTFYDKKTKTRVRKSTGCVLTSDPPSKTDLLKLRCAEHMREDLELAILNGIQTQSVMSFLDYAMEVIDVKSPKRDKNKVDYITAINSFNRHCSKIQIYDITPDIVRRYYLSLNGKSNCTKSHYIKALRHICDFAVKEKIIPDNPFTSIKLERIKSRCDYLSESELKKLIRTECTNSEVKKAFLFSVYTGLRWSDVSVLNYNQIANEHLEYTQSKTGTQERVKLMGKAMSLLEPNGKGKMFKLPNYRIMRRHLIRWFKTAGIYRKSLCFHVARHTFATLSLNAGVDIFAISKLLGHRDLATTQIYARLIDKNKDEAVDRLNSCFPDFEL